MGEVICNLFLLPCMFYSRVPKIYTRSECLLSVCPAILCASTMLEMCRHWCTHQNVEDCKLVDRLFSHSKFYAHWSWHLCLATLGDGERWWQFWRPLMQLFICCDLVFLCEPSAPLIGRIHHAWILWSVDCQDRKCLAAIVPYCPQLWSSHGWMKKMDLRQRVASISPLLSPLSSEGVFLWSLFSVTTTHEWTR